MLDNAQWFSDFHSEAALAFSGQMNTVELFADARIHGISLILTESFFS